MSTKKNKTRLDTAIDDTRLRYNNTLQQIMLLSRERDSLFTTLNTLEMIRDDKAEYLNDKS